MHSRIFRKRCGGARGVSLLEVLVAMLVFTVAVLMALVLFRGQLMRLRTQAAEKRILEEATRCLDYLSRHLPGAAVNDLAGANRMDFVGGPDRVRVVAPYSEGEGSDLVKFGVLLDGREVKVQVIRADAADPGLAFPEGFSGSQVLCGDVEVLVLSYFDGHAWFDTWDTSAGRGHQGEPPAMVRAAVTVSPGTGIEGKRPSRTLTRVIRLEAR